MVATRRGPAGVRATERAEHPAPGVVLPLSNWMPVGLRECTPLYSWQRPLPPVTLGPHDNSAGADNVPISQRTKVRPRKAKSLTRKTFIRSYGLGAAVLGWKPALVARDRGSCGEQRGVASAR